MGLPVNLLFFVCVLHNYAVYHVVDLFEKSYVKRCL